MRSQDTDRICAESWNLAVYAFGTAEIFRRRAQRYRNLIRALTAMGIIVPLLIGGIVLAFGLSASFLPWFVYFAAAVGVLQLCLSGLAVSYGWTDTLEYSLESLTDNLELSSRFEEIGKMATAPPVDLASRFAIVKARDDARRAADGKKSVTEKELRYGHRAGLRRFERKCQGCQNIPRSMESTDCSICGGF